MAKLKEINLSDLSTLNIKELRKLRITLKNRIESLNFGSNSRELKASHLLHGKSLDECNQLLQDVLKAEKTLSRS